jgi:hypothetical protein
MKRRSFLSLLGLAPAAPLIAREMASPISEPAARILAEHGLPLPTTDEHMKLLKKALRDTFPAVSGSAPLTLKPGDAWIHYGPESQDWSECTLNWDVGLASASFTASSPFEIDFGSPPDGEKR